MDKKIRIAICEDNHEYASAIKQIIHALFEQKGLVGVDFEIDVYYSGEDLIISPNQYDIILQDLDLGIGKMHGFEVARWVNKNYDIQPKIIILTSLIDQA